MPLCTPTLPTAPQTKNIHRNGDFVLVNPSASVGAEHFIISSYIPKFTTANYQYLLKLQITKLQPKHGFSSFKFIPGTNEEVIVALKTTEFEGKTATYISAFKINSQVLMEDTKIEDLKYEGLEFIWSYGIRYSANVDGLFHTKRDLCCVLFTLAGF